MRVASNSPFCSIQSIRKSFIIIVLSVVSVFCLLDAFVLKIFIPALVTNLQHPRYSTDHKIIIISENGTASEKTTPKPVHNNNSNNNNKLNDIDTLFKVKDRIPISKEQELAKMGYESVEMHAFKSPYIDDPPVQKEFVSNEKLKEKKKIISVFNIGANSWFNRFRFNADFKHCKHNCEMDFNGEKIAEADLVIFLCKGMTRYTHKRRQGQLWAIMCWESPQHWQYPDYAFWGDRFNMTMSYRLDADFFIPYVRLGWRHSSLLFKEEEYLKIAQAKSKTATWWASNCQGDRYNFVKEMKKYIDIDIFGRCGNRLPCWSNQKDFECRKAFNTTYKFYLSFENSYCKDYFTEKFNKMFLNRSHVIPVVKGGAGYDNNFPKDTFVNGDHFPNAKELALYLKKLASDMPRYSKMLQEKDRLKARPGSESLDWCDICESLHTKEFGMKRNIRSWSHAQMCQRHRYNIR